MTTLPETPRSPLLFLRMCASPRSGRVRNAFRLSFLLLLAGLFFPAPISAQDSRPAREKPTDRGKAAKMIEAAGEVMKQVEELRGKSFRSPVQKDVRTEEELRKFIMKELFEEEFGGGKLKRHQWMLEEVGLLPQGTDFAKTLIDVLLNQVGGYYDPKTKSFYMMARASSFGDLLNRTLMAHELTHALDDQYYGLARRMKEMGETEDGGFAIGAVVEGSATALMTRWMFRYGTGFDPESMKERMKAEMERSKAFFASPPYFWTLAAKYMMGMRFLLNGGSGAESMKILMLSKTGVGENLAKAMENPPLSSEQILHPEKYWDSEKKDPPAVLADEKGFEKALASTGWTLKGKETLGEIHCAILARKPRRKTDPSKIVQLLNVPSFWTNYAASGWGGDRVFLLSRGKERGLLWVTWWDEARDAEQFEKSYRRFYGESLGFRSRRDGKLLVFAFGDLRSEAEVFFALARGEAGKVVKGGRPFPLD